MLQENVIESMCVEVTSLCIIFAVQCQVILKSYCKVVHIVDSFERLHNFCFKIEYLVEFTKIEITVFHELHLQN